MNRDWRGLWHQWSQRLAGWLGETTPSGVEEPVQSGWSPNQDARIERTSLASLLPYVSYDAQTQLFHNQTSMGFVLELVPMMGATEETVNILASLVTDVLPTGADIQMLLWAGPQIGPLLDAFHANRSQRGGLFEWLSQRRINFLGQGAREPLTRDGAFLLRHFRLFITVSEPAKTADEMTMQQLLQLRDDVTATFQNVGLASQPVTVEPFMQLMDGLLHPSWASHPEIRRWEAERPLASQLTDPEVIHTIHGDRVQVDRPPASDPWAVRSYTVRDYPEHWTQVQMQQAIGQLFNSALQLPCPYALQLMFRARDAEKSQRQMHWRYLQKDRTARSPVAKLQPSLQAEYQELDRFRQYLDQGGRLVEGLFQVTTFCTAQHASQAERRVRDLFRANGWRLKRPSYIQWPLFMNLWPMMPSEGLLPDFRQLGQTRTLTAHNAVNQAPLQGEWVGTPEPLLLLPGRRGQLAGWNPFRNDGNFNVAVAAASGRGKSTLVQEYITALVGSGGRVWVIDVGRSYEKTCRLLGGEFIAFHPKNPLSINPFTHLHDLDESLAMLKPLFGAMARPHGETSDEENSWLEKALRAVWHQHGARATVTEVADWLHGQADACCRTLAHLLYPFTRYGMYGGFFDGPCDIQLDNPFIVLELEELKSQPELQQTVLHTLMHQISERMYRGRRDQRKSCVIDEAWDLMKGDNASSAQFIETGYRRSRRYNGNFITITQSINDYFQNACAQTAYDNSDWMLVLGQNEAAIDQLKNSDRFPMDAFTERILKSLRTTGDYAECAIKGGSGLMVQRVLLDPYSRILYSSKAEDHEAVKAHQARGLSLEQAIDKVADERYGTT